MGLVSRRRYRWTRGRVSDYWDEVFTPDGVRGARRRPRRPVRLHRQPRRHPLGPDARRAGHHRRRPGRHRPRRVARAPSSSTAAPAPARPSSRCTAPPTCCTPTRAWATARAACSSSARTSPTSPTSPTCCPASARRACRPARCATSCRKGRRPSRRPTRRWPGSRPTHGWSPRSSRRCACTRSRRPRAWRSTTPWGEVWLGTADWADAFDTPHARGCRTTRARDAVWEALLDILVDKLRRSEARRGRGRHDRRRSTPTASTTAGPAGEVPPGHRGQPRAGGGLRPGLAAARADRPRG